MEPDVVLMDEPCSALDPIATARIEELVAELKTQYTIVIVTHNMQQAARISDRTAFFSVEVSDSGRRTGQLVEIDRTEQIFTNPEDRELRRTSLAGWDDGADLWSIGRQPMSEHEETRSEFHQLMDEVQRPCGWED